MHFDRSDLRPSHISSIAYPAAGRAQARTALVYHCIRYARSSEEAFELGLVALNDRGRPVRHRACGLPRLLLAPRRPTCASSSGATFRRRYSAGTRAAIRAIEGRKHHLYIDRDGSGRSLWVVNPEDDHDPLRRALRPNGPHRFVQWLLRRHT
jgi:hypothetical protein